MTFLTSAGNSTRTQHEQTHCSNAFNVAMYEAYSAGVSTLGDGRGPRVDVEEVRRESGVGKGDEGFNGKVGYRRGD